MTVGKNLRKLRKSRGLNQVELGKALGYASGGQISDWETDRVKIPSRYLAELATALKLTDEEIAELGDVPDYTEAIAEWRYQVAISGLNEGVRLLLMCLPYFADDATGVIERPRDQILLKLKMDKDDFDENWKSMLATKYAKAFGSPELDLVRLIY